MSISLWNYLKVVTPYLHAELVIPSALSRLQSLAQRLPIASAALLECRLGHAGSDVDFHASFTHFPANFSTHFLPNLAWQTCQAFGEAWMDSASILNESIHNLILEFDLPQKLTIEQCIEAIRPSPYLMFKPQSNIELLALIKEALILFQRPISSELIAKLKQCLGAIPEGASLANIGVWLGRPHEAIRLTVKEIQFEQLPDYLEKIGWQDPTKEFAAYVSTLIPFVDTLAIAIDIAPNVYPRIGLECFATNQFHDQLRWQYFIDYLVQTGLCNNTKRNALLAWSGFTQRSDCPELWPVNLTYGDLLASSNAVSVFWRRINHIKIVYEPGQPLSAKSYLAFGHNWIHTDNVVFKERVPNLRVTN